MGLLAVDPELRRSRFAWLRDYSESPSPSNIIELLDRLEYARGLGIDPARAGRIHAARLARLIDEGAIMTVQHIADLEPARRTAILAVQAASLKTRLADATLAAEGAGMMRSDRTRGPAFPSLCADAFMAAPRRRPGS